MIPAAPSLGLQNPEHLLHERRDGERHLVLSARRKGYPKVLAVVLNLAPGGEVVRQELLALERENLVGCETPGEYLYDPIRRHTGLRAEDQGFGYCLEDQCNHYLVASLHHLTRPGPSDVD